MQVHLYRYNPEVDQRPYKQYVLSVQYEDRGHRGVMVLDLLESLKVADPALSLHHGVSIVVVEPGDLRGSGGSVIER